jgi:hypothetical protein
VIDHKFLEDVHEDSMLFPSQNSRLLCNRPNGPLKASGRPAVSRSFSVEDVRTSERHCQDARSSFSNFYIELDFSRHCLEVSTRRPNDVATPPDAVQHFRIFRTFFSNVKMSYSEDRLDARPSRSDVNLLWKELRYSRRRSQKTIWTRLTSIRMLDSQSSNLSRFRISVSV